MISKPLVSLLVLFAISGIGLAADQATEKKLLFQKIDLSSTEKKSTETADVQKIKISVDTAKAQTASQPLFLGAGVGFTGLPVAGGLALPTVKYPLMQNIKVEGGASYVASTLTLLAMGTYKLREFGPNAIYAGAALTFSGVNTLSGLIGCETRLNNDLEAGIYIVPLSMGTGQFMGILNNAFITVHLYI
jgi:hypothetical protein